MLVNLNYHAIVEGTFKYLKQEATNNGISVAISEKGVAYTDGKTIYVPTPAADGDLVLWRYTCEHELCHEGKPNTSPHFVEVLKRRNVKPNSFFSQAINLQADHTHEMTRIGEHLGRDRSLQEGRTRFVQKKLMPNVLKGLEDIPKLPPELQKKARVMGAMAAYDTTCRRKWNPTIEPVAGEFLSKVEKDPEIKGMIEKLIDAGLDPCVPKNTDEDIDYVEKVFKVLDIEEEIENGKGAGKPCKAGEDGEGVDMEVSPGEGHDDRVMGEKGEGYKDSEKGNPCDATCTGKGTFTPGAVKYDTCDYPAQVLLGVPSMTRRLRQGLEGGSNLATTVANMLFTMSRAKYSGGKRRGRLKASSLHRVTSNQTNVFKQKSVRVTLDTDFMVLCDSSGSMGTGTRMPDAAAATILLAETCQKLRVPLRVEMFTEGRDPIHRLVSDWDEKLSREELMKRMDQGTFMMSGNDDPSSILHALNLLYTRPNKRKVLIVISDGRPTPNPYRGDGHAFMKKMLRQAAETPNLEVYGIGIADAPVQEYYPNHACIKVTADLEKALLDVMRKEITHAV